MPLNKGANRKLDCGGYKICSSTQQGTRITTIRYDKMRIFGGTKIYPDSNFTDRFHIKICINTALIKGYFLPRPIEEFYPFLKKKYIKKKQLGQPNKK
jgi:hypothetical protein